MSIPIAFILGLAAGLAIAYFFLIVPRRKDAEKIGRELIDQFREDKARELEDILERLKGSFSILSHEALARIIDEFLKLARQSLTAHTKEGEKELESKKKLIDKSLASMTAEMDKVQDMLKTFEKERSQQYGSLASQLRAASETTSKLHETTQKLATALSSSRHRGQWGERMAEDVLRLAGFEERINYIKQKQLEGRAARPDFTFFLPQNLVVNMDVKFPLDNYIRHLNAATDEERERYKKEFLRDVSNRIKEVTSREYINPEENTVDYVLVFIPNEQIYAFIWEHDAPLIDRAMQNKVVLCSPITLLAILGVIRKAFENFSLKETTSSILSLLGNFLKQWKKFTGSLEKMGKKIEEAQQEYERLSTTRRRELERPLRKIDRLRQQKGIEAAAMAPDEAEPRALEEAGGRD